MRRVFAIATTTFRESIRSKVLYSMFFFAIAIVLVSALFGSVTIGDQVVVIRNFGLFSLSFFGVAYAVISGASLLAKELARKTIYNVLAKPVRRWEFLWGKYLGMLTTVTLMIIVMAAGLIGFTLFFDSNFNPAMIQATYQIILQLMIVCACTIFFSSIVVTPLLSGAFAFGVFLAGRSTEYLLYFVNNQSIKGILAGLLKGAYWLLPHLNELDMSNHAAYGETASLAFMLWSSMYAIGYSGILLVLANLFFLRREFN